MLPFVKLLLAVLLVQHLIGCLLVSGTASDHGNSTNSAQSPAKTKPKSKPKVSKAKVSFQYHDYDSTTNFLKLVHERFPKLTRLYSIGKSVEGRELWVLHLSE